MARRGFSLVELLIVIAIIALLIAILMPALTAAREHARRVVCLSNIRQLDVAWMMYANEHHGRFCSSETQTFGEVQPNYRIAGIYPLPQGFWSWMAWGTNQHDLSHGLLWPYLKDLQVYSCPDNPVLPNTTYAINGLLAGRIGQESIFHGTPVAGRTLLTLSEITHPERTFVFIEAMRHRDDGDGDFDSDDVGNVIGPLTGSFCTPVYPDRLSQCPGLYHQLGGIYGTTIAFADGHAIFWQYAGTPLDQFATTAVKLPAPDLVQLQAWSGGRVPPGAVP